MPTFMEVPVEEAQAQTATDRNTGLKLSVLKFLTEYLPENGVTFPLKAALVTGKDAQGNFLGIGWNDFPEYVHKGVEGRDGRNAGLKAIAGCINRDLDKPVNKRIFAGTWARHIEDKDAKDNKAGTIIFFNEKPKGSV